MVLDPDLVVEAAWTLTPAKLRSLGIDGVLVDLDDTLLPSGSLDLATPVLRWFAELDAASIPAVVVSNGEPRRVRHVCERLGVDGIALVGKPLPLAFRRGVRRLGVPVERAAMIGDQLFTDVLGANLVGLTSILVAPLSQGGLPHTRLARHLERRILSPTPTPVPEGSALPRMSERAVRARPAQRTVLPRHSPLSISGGIRGRPLDR